ncbi:MAG: hypothetical protein PUC76_08035 [Clostridia bacterium]|nr:hypothetical protein [Clostridia bacterium]
MAHDEGLEPSGKISLEEAYSAPVVIIKSKVFVESSGGAAVSYGQGCYCGGFNAGESILKRSL